MDEDDLEDLWKRVLDEAETGLQGLTGDDDDDDDDDDDVKGADTGSFPAINVCYMLSNLLILIRCWVNRFFLYLVCQN
jgi:hypothetical protein